MGKDSSEIRREIESTRARMGDTVEALGYKADIPSRAKDAVNERVETVKGTLGDVMDSVKNAVSGTSSKVGSALGGASGIGGSLGDTLSETRDRVSGTLSDTRDRVGDAVANVDVQGTAQRAVGIAAENPIGLALGALAVGFLAGMLVPVTDIENERLGPVRDELVGRAQSVANDVVEQGKAVIAETAQAAVSSAQQHGQTVVANAQTAS